MGDAPHEFNVGQLGLELCVRLADACSHTLTAAVSCPLSAPSVAQEETTQVLRTA